MNSPGAGQYGPEDRGKPAPHERQKVDQEDSARGDDDFQAGIRENGSADAMPVSRRERVAQSQAAHETSQDERRRPDAIAKSEACLAEPEVSEDERRAAGQKENQDEKEDRSLCRPVVRARANL